MRALRIPYFYTFLALWLAALTLITLWHGVIPFSVVWQGAIERYTSEIAPWNPLLDERIPRLLVLLMTGASLATAGLVMQALFQNPLASPSILGIHAGSSLSVLVIFIWGWHYGYPFVVPLAAFVGACVALMLLCALAKLASQETFSNLILTGIALTTILLAVQATLVYALRDRWQLIQTVTEWEAASTLDRSWKHFHMQAPLAICGLFICWYYRREIDILALGTEEAASLGVPVAKIQWRLILAVAALTAGAMAALGSIPFFGLILPHILRKGIGSAHRELIPLTMATGAVLLLTLDTALRLAAIRSMTIGHLSALLGGAFFLWLLTLGSSESCSKENLSA